MDPLPAIESLLAAFMTRSDEAPEPLGPLGTALAAFWIGDFDACGDAADDAQRSAVSATDHALADAAVALAVAGGSRPVDRARWEVDALDALPDDGLAALARHLTAEAALSCARLDVALTAVGAGGSWQSSWSDHPYALMMCATEIRTAAFAGRLDLAVDQLGQLRALGERIGRTDLASAVETTVLGNAAEVERTRMAIAALLAAEVAPVDRVGRGVHVLAAFGAMAIGEQHLASTLVLLAGGDDLGRLTVIDRALALETLVTTAVHDGDVDAARSWLARAEGIADHPIARPAIDRATAGVAMLTGDLAAAEQLAMRAIERARVEDRGIEAAYGEVVLARVRIAAQDRAGATRGLRAAVTQSDAHGHHAMRRMSGAELRRAGRRLPPPAAGGWDALSTREREVADLILAGLDERAIAAALFLSPATVRVHTSRVLAAFAVGSRVALLAQQGPRGDRGVPLPALTARQCDVTELVAAGATNAEIAQILDLSVKAVEKHVGDAMRRVGVRSRFDLAVRWLRDGHPE